MPRIAASRPRTKSSCWYSNLDGSCRRRPLLCEPPYTPRILCKPRVYSLTRTHPHSAGTRTWTGPAGACKKNVMTALIHCDTHAHTHIYCGVTHTLGAGTRTWTGPAGAAPCSVNRNSRTHRLRHTLSHSLRFTPAWCWYSNLDGSGGRRPLLCTPPAWDSRRRRREPRTGTLSRGRLRSAEARRLAWS